MKNTDFIVNDILIVVNSRFLLFYYIFLRFVHKKQKNNLKNMQKDRKTIIRISIIIEYEVKQKGMRFFSAPLEIFD